MIMKLLLLLTIVASFGTTQRAGNEEEDVDDYFKNNNNNSTLSEDESKLCNDGFGECVPFYQCNNGTINTDGSTILDIRFNPENECKDYLETCCNIEDKIEHNAHLKTSEVPSKCGKRNPEGIGFTITGNNDNEAEYGEFPWMVAILKQQNVGDKTLNVYKCGGSLVTPNVVLTAAHCVFNESAIDYKLRFGEWDTQTKNELFPQQDYSVAEIIVHENFNRRNLENDVAIMILDGTLQISEHINTICLPPQNKFFDRTRCFASGWGRDVFGKEGKYQVILKKVDLPTVSFAQCQNHMRKTRLGRRFILHNSFMCAGGEEGKDVCQGDGGSPLVCPIEEAPGHYFQAGIVAWGIGCGDKNIPGVYVDVSYFRSWIDQTISSKNLPTTDYIINI